MNTVRAMLAIAVCGQLISAAESAPSVPIAENRTCISSSRKVPSANMQGYMGMASDCFNTGNVSEACAHLEKALAVAPDARNRTWLRSIMAKRCPKRPGARQGPPKCGDFFTQWDTVRTGIPPETGVLAEITAGNDCLSKRQIVTGCSHFKRALQVLNEMYPRYADIRSMVERLVSINRCQ